MKRILYFLTLIILSTGCSNTDCDCLPFDKQVAFYLLKSPQPAVGFNPDLTNPVLQNKPFIVFSEIVQYDSATFEFTLKKAALERIEAIDKPTPFAVSLNRQIIYTGYFWQFYLSSTCNGILIDSHRTFSKNNNIIQLRPCAGPNPALNLNALAKCNDERLLQVLARAGKLK
jgi:hypothetical protein